MSIVDSRQRDSRMIRAIRLFSITATVVLTAAANAQADGLAGSEWRIAGNNGPFVQFGAGGQVTGDGGCNRFFGSYEIGDNKVITIGPLASTRKACPGSIMNTEARFFQDLEAAKQYRFDHLSLKLFDQSGNLLTNLIRRDWD